MGVFELIHFVVDFGNVLKLTVFQTKFQTERTDQYFQRQRKITLHPPIHNQSELNSHIHSQDFFITKLDH